MFVSGYRRKHQQQLDRCGLMLPLLACICLSNKQTNKNKPKIQKNLQKHKELQDS
jgi:hypothetical protein